MFPTGNILLLRYDAKCNSFLSNRISHYHPKVMTTNNVNKKNTYCDSYKFAKIVYNDTIFVKVTSDCS